MQYFLYFFIYSKSYFEQSKFASNIYKIYLPVNIKANRCSNRKIVSNYWSQSCICSPAQVATIIRVEVYNWGIRPINFCNNQVKQVPQKDVFMDGWVDLGPIRYCVLFVHLLYFISSLFLHLYFCLSYLSSRLI